MGEGKRMNGGQLTGMDNRTEGRRPGGEGAAGTGSHMGGMQLSRERPADRKTDPAPGFRYMTEEELEALVAEVEAHGMLTPPAYLKELIMEEAGKSAKSSEKKGIDRKTARIRLMAYSAKIIGAAAVAVFCLTMVPMDLDGGMVERGSQRREEVMEEDMARYQEESERIRKESARREGGFRSLLENVLGTKTVGTAISVWDDFIGWF